MLIVPPFHIAPSLRFLLPDPPFFHVSLSASGFSSFWQPLLYSPCTHCKSSSPLSSAVSVMFIWALPHGASHPLAPVRFFPRLTECLGELNGSEPGTCASNDLIRGAWMVWFKGSAHWHIIHSHPKVSCWGHSQGREFALSQKQCLCLWRSVKNKMLWQTAEGNAYLREIFPVKSATRTYLRWSSHEVGPGWHRGNLLTHHHSELGSLLGCGPSTYAGCFINTLVSD